MASDPVPWGHPDVKGLCPACGSASLFLGSGGYVTCRVYNCPDPGAAADALLSSEIRRGRGFRGHLESLCRAFAYVSNEVKVMKIGEEFGEAVQAFIGLIGANPRKGIYANADDVADELADVAITALVAMEGFTPDAIQHLTNRMRYAAQRIEEALANA